VKKTKISGREGEGEYEVVTPLNNLHVYLWATAPAISRKVCQLPCKSQSFRVKNCAAFPPGAGETEREGDGDGEREREREREKLGSGGGVRVPHVRIGDELAQVICEECGRVVVVVRATVEGRLIDYFAEGEREREKVRERERDARGILAIVAPFGGSGGEGGKKRKGKGGE
jgi:hypothetical protein